MLLYGQQTLYATNKQQTMKTLFLLILCIITTGQVMADCAGSGIYAFPWTKTIKQNSLILLTGYANSEEIITSLNKEYPVYLESKGHKVKLNVKSTHKGMFQLTQAVLEPNEKLIVGRTYLLVIDEVKSTTLTRWNPELGKNTPIAWKVESGMDNTIPNFVEQPEFSNTRIEFFGCGPEVYAVFKIKTEDESEILVKTELVDIESGASNIYFLTFNETDLLNVGHGMCSGAFDYKKEGQYKVRFKLMDICGNENKEWSDWIAFDSPFEGH